jgi:hypothetical protein
MKRKNWAFFSGQPTLFSFLKKRGRKEKHQRKREEFSFSPVFFFFEKKKTENIDEREKNVSFSPAFFERSDEKGCGLSSLSTNN